MNKPPASLLFGPYEPPDTSGGWLIDQIHGAVEVGGWTNAPIPWPRRKKTGRHSPILCDDLIRAVALESSAAIQHHWGVSAATVWTWRQAIGVGRITPGTRERLKTETGVPPDAAERGRQAAASPESIERRAEMLRGRSAHPNTAKALKEAASKPKPEGWGKRANGWMQAAKRS